MEIIYAVLYLFFVMQMLATVMWASGMWSYKTDATYRVKYGKPEFWFWNQIYSVMRDEAKGH